MKIFINTGASVVRKRLDRLAATAGTVAILLTCGCMGGGEVAPPGNSAGTGTGASGKVVQGAVSGATVFADKIVANGLGDMVMDSSEISYKTVTDSAGHFTLPAAPSYSYVIVSRGGTDTLSGKPAIMMLAPAGAQNVSALTTMVAIDPTLKTKMESLMGGASYDTDISQSVSPAALMLAKTIEISVQALTETLNPGGNTLSNTQVNDIQLTTLTNLATQISALSTTDLSSPAALESMVTTAVTATATAIDSRHTNINIGSAATLSSNIAATVPTIATTISGSATASLSSTGSSSEDSQLTPSDQNSLSVAINIAVSRNDATISVAAPITGPDSTAPAVTVTTPANGISFAPNGSITAVFSEALDLSTVALANFSVTGATGDAVTWSNSGRSVTFTGTLPASSTVTVTVSGMKDLSGNTMTSKNWSFTTAAAADTVKPTVSSTIPAASATGINSSSVSATFSENMKLSTMNGATFYLLDGASGLLVPGAVSYDVATRTMTFTPYAKLNRATVYTATITTGAKDQSDNALAAAVTWSFTTTTTGSSTTVANF